MLFLGASSGLAASYQVQALVSIPSLELPVGQSAEIDVQIQCAAASCDAFQISVTYDPTVLRVDSAANGDFLGRTGNQVFGPQIMGSSAGLVQIAAATFNSGGAPMTGDGVLFRLNVTALQAGDTQISITELIITDLSAAEVPSTSTIGVVNVTDVVVPTASTTPMLEILRDIVARSGPGSQYDALVTLTAGERLEITGLSEDGSWYQVRLSNGLPAWLAASPAIGTASGDLRLVPIIIAPPISAPVATATLPAPTDIPLPTSTYTPVPSPTPVPAGRLPFIEDFEGDSPLRDWDYDSSVWQVVNEGGEHLLLAQGVLSQPMVVLGRAAPEWVNSYAGDLVLSFRFNITPQAAGGRAVFRYSDQGYYALEYFPGVLMLRRNGPTTSDVTRRDSERVIEQWNGAPIQGNTWHHVTIWALGNRIYVYLDYKLVMLAEDNTIPALGAGRVMLQANSSFNPIRFDDLIVQRAESYSERFESSGLPETWRTTSATNIATGQESDGNQYLELRNDVTINPVMGPVRDLTMHCRLWNVASGYQMRLRENPGGVVQLDMDAGNMTISRLDSEDNVVTTYAVPNFYNRGRWDDVYMTFVGDRLIIYRDGRVFFDEVIPNSPAAGTLSFSTSGTDVLRMDDCLFTEAAYSSNEGARFVYALINEVNARTYRWLRSDLDENFDSRLRTQDWWLDGTGADGQFNEDPLSSEHTNFLRMTHDGNPTWRLFRDVIGIEIFGSGTDDVNYTNSTDLYISVDARFLPNTDGTAWLGIRSSPSITGAEIDGYRVELRRNPDGSTDVVVRYIGAAGQILYYEGPVPGSEGSEPLPEWVKIEAVAFQDKLGILVNGGYVTTIDATLVLGGTLALGVDETTTVDFDTLVIRDTTPHGGQFG